MEKSINLNSELEEYNKRLKEYEKYKDKKEPYKKRFDEPITHELDEYMKNLSVDLRLKPNKLDKKEPSGILVDFMKITNHSIEDITKSLHKSASKLVEDMTYSLYSLKKPLENKVEVNKNLDAVKEKEPIKQEPIKQELKEVDMKKELDKVRRTDKELYKNLESIGRITNKEMQSLNNTYQKYNDLVNMANECNLGLGYDQRMSGIKVYGESKRSIEANQAELVSIAKGETKEQITFKNTNKAMSYIEGAEKKIENLKSQNKLLDIRGNMDRNLIIKDINKEIESQKQILKDNGINNKEDFNKLKDTVLKREDSFKSLIESENTRYKEEVKENKKEEKLSKQMEQSETNAKDLQSTRNKKTQLER